jgi:(p)ppGpp synthase/HD superfamily hydrolase
MNKIVEAARFARHVHCGQFRKYTNVPYITHPERVALRLMYRPDSTEELICAGWLHDTIEDCPNVSEKTIASLFGPEVARIVVEVTNTAKKTHPHLNRAARKRMDLGRLAAVSHEAKILKLIDRIDNLNEFDRQADPEFANVYHGESMDLAEALKEADQALYLELITTWP